MTPHEPDCRLTGDAAAEPPVSVSYFVRALKAYRLPILLSLAGVAVAYTIVALVLYLRAPSHSTTALAFRLDFKGADSGLYPNGVKFGPGDIVAAPILLKVFRDNRLERYTSVGAFANGVYVLESNPAYAALAAEYASRLADARLTTIDRERIQSEFEAKRASLAKNEYTIHWLRDGGEANVPQQVAGKALLDVLDEWARFASQEQRVLEYRLSVLSPDILNPTPVEQADAIVAIQVLRSNVRRVLDNLAELERVPGAEVIRTRTGMSLAEIRLRVEEIVRFQLEPLIGRARASGLVPDVAATVAVIESQLEYDERQLQSYMNEADAIRQALALYTADPNAVTPLATATPPPPGLPRAATRRTAEGEPVNTQLTDSFIDRLVTLTAQSSNLEFRQKLIEDYRKVSDRIVPAQQVVAYDRAVLERLREPPPVATSDSAAVRASIVQARTNIRDLVTGMNEIHQTLSRAVNPTSQLITLRGSPTTYVRRGADGRRLALFAPLVLLITLPVAIVVSLLHHRLREEERRELTGTPHADGATKPLPTHQTHS